MKLYIASCVSRPDCILLPVWAVLIVYCFLSVSGYVVHVVYPRGGAFHLMASRGTILINAHQHCADRVRIARYKLPRALRELEASLYEI